MVVMAHNTDIRTPGNVKARAGILRPFSPNGYAVGVNIMLYAMTH